jgi:peroxisomal membrane protein 4
VKHDVKMSGLLDFCTSHSSECCPHNSCVLAVLRGFRQGLFYGAKVRLPHAAVMTFLFAKGSLSDKLRFIFKATYTHSRNLGMYAAFYKLITCVMRNVRGVESPMNSIVGGMVGGYFMFGDNNPINAQINMYVFSRICFGAVRACIKQDYFKYWDKAYPIYASLIWGAVMYLFEHQGTLQNSLTRSMVYLYKVSGCVCVCVCDSMV